MPLLKKFPAPLTLLMIITLFSALATWLLPAGKYNTLSCPTGNKFILKTAQGEMEIPFTQKTLDSLRIRIQLVKFMKGSIRKPVSIPGSYHQLPKNKQGIVQVLEAPIRGMYDTIDIILFILIIGGFINVFNESGAIEKGLISLSHKMKGKESWLIITLSFLFILAGSSYGMAEESLAFYPVLVPVFLMAGYDLIVPVAVIFMGTQIGTLSSVSDPFSTIIASNAAGINWTDGLSGRILMLLVSSVVTIYYTVRYAEKVKKNPSASLVYRVDGRMPDPITIIHPQEGGKSLDRKTAGVLLLFTFTFLLMIYGVVALDWWLLEMSAVFLASSLLVCLLTGMKEKIFIDKFLKGAESLLGVAFIIGVARGVTSILNDGLISDTILYYSAQLVSRMPSALFIVILFLLYMCFTLFISSTSGMAVLTMPIMGALGIMAGIPGREVVNAYLFGMGVMGIITPTGLILPALALVNVSYKAWLKFAIPLMLILAAICASYLTVAVLK